jgi:glycosyltransferase involved in cell wall biosynthesis
MKKIKVQLDFNISKNIHSLYHSFFNNPPLGIEYSKSEFRGINSKNYSILGKIRKIIIKFFPPFEKLDKFIISFLRKESKTDLIHFTFHVGNTNKRCVIDYESAYNFIDIRDINNKENKKAIINILKRKNFKFLIPIHNEALKSFKLFFGNKIKIPQLVVYPTIFIPKKNRKKVLKKKRVIFVSTSNILTNEAFLIKGGLETLRSFEFLAKKYSSYEFVILGKIPKKFLKILPENIILKEFVPREKLWEILNESQIFVQPAYQAPAMAFIEAMFFKLPIITTSFWGNLEYVDDTNGIIINSKKINHIDKNNVPYYDQKILGEIENNSENNSKKISVAIEKLIKNPKLREKLGNNGFQRVLNGKFSIKEKNKKLKKIYKEALN